MAELFETRERRLLAPDFVFGGRCVHACKHCDGRMVVPAPNSKYERLEDGQIWACGHCGALHEYYMAYTPGVRTAVIRLLWGPHVREGGEPKVTEFMEPAA